MASKLSSVYPQRKKSRSAGDGKGAKGRPQAAKKKPSDGIHHSTLEEVSTATASLGSSRPQPAAFICGARMDIHNSNIPAKKSATSPRVVDVTQDTPPFKQLSSLKGVKVTFRVKKKCDLGSAVYVFGFHNNLGCGSTAKAVPLSSVDGEVWWTQITFSPNEQISYKYVVRRLEQDMELSDTHESIIQSNPCVFETVWH